MQFRKLSLNEAAESDLTHKVTLEAADLTDADSSQDLTLIELEAGAVVRRVMAKLNESFVAGATTSASSITCSVGTTSDTAALMTATELDKNSSNVAFKNGTSTVLVPSSGQPVVARFTSAANLDTITNGSLDIFLGISKLPAL